MADPFSLFGCIFRFQLPSEVLTEETMTFGTKLVRKGSVEVRKWTQGRKVSVVLTFGAGKGLAPSR